MEKVIKEIIEIKPDQHEIEAVCIGDIHKGHECHERKEAKDFFEKVMQWCYDNKKVYVIGMGDFIEAGTKLSYGTFTQDMFATDQIKYIIDIFKPLADEGRLLGLHEGNHERRIRNITGLNIIQLVCENILKVPYLGAGRIIELVLANYETGLEETYSFYTGHGGTTSYTIAGKMNAIRRFAQIAPFVEIYCMGHTHSLLHFVEDGYNNMGELVPKHFVLTGGYLEYWDSYGQEKGFPPTRMGSPKIKLHTNEHRISVSEA